MKRCRTSMQTQMHVGRAGVQVEMGLGEELRQTPEALMATALQGPAKQALLVFQILLALGAAFSRQHRYAPIPCHSPYQDCISFAVRDFF